MSREPQLVWDGAAALGEAPLWLPAEDAVLFVDIRGACIYRYRRRDCDVTRWRLPEACCWLVARTDDDGFVAGLRTRVVHLRLGHNDVEIVRELAAPESEDPGNRFNDGKAGPEGRIWAGTMDDAETRASGSLYRLDAGGMTAVDSGYVVSNGPAFSPDGGTLYHTDSFAGRIYAFDLRPDGRVENRRVHIRLPSSEGVPDGMTCDAEGALWVAHFGGGLVSRFTPDGRRERRIGMPVRCITSCTFAGPALDELYVTTARPDGEGTGGGLYRLTPGVSGLPPARFDPSSGTGGGRPPG
ncbi:SMP-30/gluconolactonase/LRE family protein [Arhodomonas aquaeolei]|uniref:SMP-30/gluconolactonase/LRE family protein n=1 Tax=Arhodomonas aquaeolei TaxID=2369 RepID=UPI00037CABDF|nr:SMP-30/gluconolactonase/LRE family protein [Arhodomonas aquaeolei]MCS4503638.1 SMP-30/gluconolactonase/LRE family protein [Arhodomonas aquaeolei]